MTVSPAALRTHVEAWLEGPAPAGSVFAVLHEGDWTSAERLVVSGTYVDVRRCVSELAVREALSGDRHNDHPLVVLTATDRLAEDVLARVWKQRVFRLHPVDTVMGLFGVRSIDPELARARWLLDALVAVAPPEGYERSGARELDLARAWAALLRHRHRIEVEAGLEGLLSWASSDRAGELAELPDAELQATCGHLDERIPGAGGVLAAVRAGLGADALALGLVVRAILTAPESAARVEARTRLEMTLGGWAFDERAAGTWADRAEDLVLARLEVGAPDSHTVLQHADRLLERLHAGALAGASNVLSAGLRQRRADLAAALDKDRPADIDAAVDRVLAHRLAHTMGADHVALMAQRLVRWLAAEEPEPSDLIGAAAQHAQSSAYADWARTVLRHGGGEPRLDEALRRLVATADARRTEQERRFATLLAEWAARAPTSDDVLGVEDMLAKIVAPLATQQPLLAVVLDGMSHRVGAELLEDLVQSGWTELRRAQRPGRTLVISALPSATRFSRASLLAGELAEGLAAAEARAFAAHPALAKAGARLFHKGAIADPHGGLAEPVRAAIDGSDRVVGVVVNAIDDHLSRDDQLRSPWSVRDVPPLGWLLDAAREAGRLVVVLSDHGHVLEHGARQRSAPGGGERWRPEPPAAGDGEIAVEGPRVLTAGGRCVMAWDEGLRYAPRKHGYHGGASAQEVLAPVLVLAPAIGEELAGWTEAPYDPPAWWSGVDAVVAPAPAPAEDVQGRPGEQLTLDARERPWIDALLASETLVAQRMLATRTPLADDRIALVLSALDGHGNTMLREALARACGMQPTRLAGTLAALRLLLNVEGYPVLEVDDASDTVRFNRTLLAEQFGL